MALDVVILSAPYGAGHNAVSQAILEALGEARPELRAKVVNYFDFVSPTLTAAAQFAYVKSVRYTPALWGAFYYGTHNLSGESMMSRRINRLGRKEFLDFVEAEDPKVFVCTYPVPAGVISTLKGDGVPMPPCITVITDYVVHSQWIHRRVDVYLVPSERVRKGLGEKGLDIERVFVTGIPVGLRFAQPKDPREIRRSIGLDPDLPTVVVMAGAFPMLGGVEGAVAACLEAHDSVQAAVICGFSKKLEETLRQKYAGDPRLAVFGFVTNVDELFEAADLLVTKAGGITVSEGLAKARPMVIFRPIPGQESFNTEYLMDEGAGVSVRTPEELFELLKNTDFSVASSPGASQDRAAVSQGSLMTGLDLVAMAAAARRIGRPRAAAAAAEKILDVFDASPQ